MNAIIKIATEKEGITTTKTNITTITTTIPKIILCNLVKSITHNITKTNTRKTENIMIEINFLLKNKGQIRITKTIPSAIEAVNIKEEALEVVLTVIIITLTDIVITVMDIKTVMEVDTIDIKIKSKDKKLKFKISLTHISSRGKV